MADSLSYAARRVLGLQKLDRVEGVQAETSIDFELARVLGREVEHDAAVAFELDDAMFVDGSAARRRKSIRPPCDVPPKKWTKSSLRISLR